LIAIQRAVLDDELRLQALLRLTPLNPATVSYMLGAAGVDFSKFLIACCAMAPNLLLELYLGHAGKNLAWAGAGDARVELQDFAIVVGLVAMLAVVLVISRMARKAVMQAVTESGENRSKGSPTLRDE
jgi:hypothetical protein